MLQPEERRHISKKSLDFPATDGKDQSLVLSRNVSFNAHLTLTHLYSLLKPPTSLINPTLQDLKESAVRGNFMPTAFSIREKQKNLPPWGHAA